MENLTIPEHTTLLTMYVTSLYTNISHDDGIAACRKIWEQRTVQEPPTDCLVEMLTLVLKNTILLLTKLLSSNKWDSYGNQNDTLLCQQFYGGPRRTITSLVT
jgi:hypothetical protein